MCDYMAGIPGINCPHRREMAKYFEAALIAVVRAMLLRGFEKFPPRSSIPPPLIAATISGAIYSAVNEWLRTPDRCSAEEIVHPIFTLVQPMLC